MHKKWQIKTQGMGLVITILAFVIIALMIPSVAAGAMTVGLLIALTQAIMTVMYTSTWELNWAVDALAKFASFSEDLNTFFSYKETALPEAATLLPADFVFKRLEFRSVRFCLS